MGIKQDCLDRFSEGGENFLREHIRSLRPHYMRETPEIATGLSTRKALDKLVVWLRAQGANVNVKIYPSDRAEIRAAYHDALGTALDCRIEDGRFRVTTETAQDFPEAARALYAFWKNDSPTETEDKEEETMSEKNAAAFLRNDTKTVGVRLLAEGTPQKEYTYVTTIELAVDDHVVVPAVSDQNFMLAKVTRVDTKLNIEPRAGMKYKWIAAKVDLTGYQATLEANQKIEGMLAESYRKQAQTAYKEQLLALAGDNEQLRALIGNGS